MKRVIDTENIPVKMWLENVEPNCMEQIKNLANLPFAYKHVAIMPDSHMGYGMPIGGVLATQGVVIPNAVGVDIGCGMCAVQTSLKEISTEQIKKIFGGSKEHKGGIRSAVPVGFSHHSKKQDEIFMPNIDVRTCYTTKDDYPIIHQEYTSALKQIGTLGGGNHFIEIQKGSDGYIWLMIHSGSRNLGYKVAKHYNNVAKALNEKWYTSVPIKTELAFLPMDTKEYHNYMREMNYCLEFALANRQLMMSRIKEIVKSVTACTFESEINIHHNYATLEHHFGKNVMVHRKGATSAKEGELGIIPGSQGTKSYIVKGKGNTDSFTSCSHGAGRKMGRKQAQRELNLEEEQKKLEAQGILHSIRGVKQLDEASGAYKDIQVVMANQSDLVEILVELTPLGVIKG